MFRFKINKFSLFAISILFVFYLSGCYFLPKEEDVIAPPLLETPKVTFDTVEVQKGDIEKILSVVGKFISVYQQSLSFKFRSGYLKVLNVKTGDRVKKGDVLAMLDTDSLESQIRDQEIIVSKNEIWYNVATLDPDETKIGIEIKKLDLEASKNRLSDMQNEYAKAKILSPIDGIVVFVDEVNFGDYVGANKTLLIIADPTRLQVEYTGGDSSNFKLGDQVTVGYKNQELKGKVVMTPATVPADADNNLKNSMRVSVDGLPADISVGDPATIVLVQARNQNAVKIPRGLVNSYNGRNYVFVLDDKGVKTEKDIEIGIQTPTEVEIVKGLNAGDKVIVR